MYFFVCYGPVGFGNVSTLYNLKAENPRIEKRFRTNGKATDGGNEDSMNSDGKRSIKWLYM